MQKIKVSFQVSKKSHYNCLDVLSLLIVRSQPSQLRIPHLQIPPTTDRKYLKKKWRVLCIEHVQAFFLGINP